MITKDEYKLLEETVGEEIDDLREDRDAHNDKIADQLEEILTKIRNASRKDW